MTWSVYCRCWEDGEERGNKSRWWMQVCCSCSTKNSFALCVSTFVDDGTLALPLHRWAKRYNPRQRSYLRFLHRCRSVSWLFLFFCPHTPPCRRSWAANHGLKRWDRVVYRALMYSPYVLRVHALRAWIRIRWEWSEEHEVHKYFFTFFNLFVIIDTKGIEKCCIQQVDISPEIRLIQKLLCSNS